MEIKEIIEVLDYHQKWRSGSNLPQTDQTKLTEALDGALEILIGKSSVNGQFYTHEELNALVEESYQDGYEEGQWESA